MLIAKIVILQISRASFSSALLQQTPSPALLASYMMLERRVHLSVERHFLLVVILEVDDG